MTSRYLHGEPDSNRILSGVIPKYKTEPIYITVTGTRITTNVFASGTHMVTLTSVLMTLKYTSFFSFNLYPGLKIVDISNDIVENRQ